MGMNLKLSSSASGTRNIPATEQGGGQYLLARNLLSPKFRSPVSARTNDLPAASTAEYYGLDGLTDFMCYDLRNMGSAGAAVESAKGYRYAWTLDCDHPMDDAGEEGGWGRDAKSMYIGFSNDPCIPPSPATMRKVIANRIGTVPGAPGTGYSSYFNSCLVHNPSDPTYPFHLYIGSAGEDGTGTVGLSMLLFGRADFDGEFTVISESHPCSGNGLTSYQKVYRDNATDWHSYGGFDQIFNDGSIGKWVSTDGGQNFTQTGSDFNQTIGSRLFADVGRTGFLVDINGQLYSCTREASAGAGTTAYVTLVAFSDTAGVLASPAPIRISDAYDGIFPIPFNLDAGDGHLQYTPNYEEDGVLIIFATHNFASDVGLPGGSRDKLPENGGGTNEQYIDLYGYPIPGKEALAATSAPFGVRASCNAGVVTLSWYDLPAGRTYRVYRGTTAGTQATLIGDVTGTSMTNSPTSGSVYYYKVVSLNAGVEQQSRVVSTYVR